jgi:putative oxidoreductase
MKIAVLVSRILLGLGFTVFGLNIIHPFLPQPPFPENSLPLQFMTVMGPTHYMTVVGVFQLLGGVILLSGRLVPLGLALLAPVLVNILVFHFLLMNGEGVAPGLVFSAFELFLIYAYWGHFKSLFTVHAKPSV